MFKSIVKITLGGGMAQLIQFLGIPLIAIVYSPQEIGNYFATVAITSILTIFISLQLQHAIPNKKNKYEVEEIITTLILLTVIAIIISIFINLTTFSYKHIIFWAMLMAALSTISAMIRSLLVRKGKFNYINALILTKSIFVVASQFLLSFTINQNGLYIGFIIGETASLFLFIYIFKKNIKSLFEYKIKILKCIIDNKNFTLYATIQETISVGVLSLPAITIPFLFNSNLAGQFGMAQRIIMPIASILLGSIVTVIQHEYGQKEKFAAFESSFFNIKKIIFFILATSLTSYLFISFIHFLIPNKNWEKSFECAYYIAIWAIFLISSSPFRACVRIYNLQKTQATIDLLILSILIIFSYYVKNSTIDFDIYIKFICTIGILQNSIISISVIKLNKKFKNS